MRQTLASFSLSTDIHLLDVVEIALLFAVIYAFLRFLRKTVAGGIVRGPALLVWSLVIGLFFVVSAESLGD